MPGCAPFQIHISGSLEETLARVKQEAAKQGVIFTGDTTGGSFSGRGIIGKYTVMGKFVTVTITQLGAPASWMYDCLTIEQEVRRFFE